MTQLVVSPVQWARLKDIDDVEPVHEGDAMCLAEIRDVLKRHGKIERFGVALLHSHFELNDDEILLESTDVGARRLVSETIKQSDAGNSNVGTIWMLRDGDHATMSWCRSYCKRLPISNTHDKGHNREKQGHAEQDYERAGTCNIFVADEPRGRRRITQVTARRTKTAFVAFVCRLLRSGYSRARKVHLVLDNLNTHLRESFEHVLDVKTAATLLRRIEFYYTPKHASWLNMAEIEIGILQCQCLARCADLMARAA